MSIISATSQDIPISQKLIHARSVHPTGTYLEFARSEMEQSIPDRFEKQVCANSNRIAVTDSHQQITYDELDQSANRVAHAILSVQSRPGQPVAFLLEQGGPSVVAILGILKSGNCYVPLDPYHPYERTGYVLHDSTARIIVTNENNLPLARQLAPNEREIINMDHPSSWDSAGRPGLSISYNDLAYIMYTSGSTGKPKGVMDTHRNVLHQILVYTDDCHLTSDDRLTLLRSCSFNGSVRDIFGALLNGAGLYSLDIVRDKGQSLKNWLLEQRITACRLVTSVYRQLLNELTGEGNLPDVRLFYIGGEPVYSSDVRLFQDRLCPSCVLFVGLGITETGGTITWHFIDHHTHFEASSIVPIGYPIIDTEIVLLDDKGEPCEYGDEGEICVRSMYLSPGYWRRPELTMQAFLPDPEGGDRRIYRTGDMGMLLDDGCLIHLGRKDTQVKLRGQRVEISEVESALLNLPAVKDAVVVARSDSIGETRLVAYVVPRSNPGPTVTILRKQLSQLLPNSMIPTSYVMMEALPFSPIGKVDRSQLPEPQGKRPELDTTFVEPRTLIEQELARIWSDLLFVEPVGIDDDFLDLGGHSLHATQMVARVMDAFQVKLTLSSVFESPTVAQMALQVIAALTEDAGKK